MTQREKKIVVLGRRDHAEAMRVAAGLTIFGHDVQLVLMDRAVEDTPENRKQAELLELAEIEPQTTVAGSELPHLSAGALAELMTACEVILSI